MKHIIIAAAITLFSGFAGIAQTTVKLGHVNSQDIISKMPEYLEMQTVLQEKTKELEGELIELQKVYKTKFDEYNNPATTDTRRKVLEGDLVDLEERMGQRQEAGQAQLEQLSASLRTPILEKIDKAIKEVAAEGKFTYVFDTAALLYFNGGEDLTPVVKGKLGMVAP
jgi:outer membrane protein